MRRVLSLAALSILLCASAADAQSSKSPAKPAKSTGTTKSGTAKSAGAKSSSTKVQPASKDPTRGASNQAVRRQIAAGPTAEDAGMGAETPELASLRAAERELFPPAAPPLGTSWPSLLPFPARPEVHASGVPEARTLPETPRAEGDRDLSWMSKVTLPELPVTWHPRVVRYIEFFTRDPRGRSSVTVFARRAGRYEEQIRGVLRQKGLPEDLLWLSMVESAHDPRARSPVGAAGLWQFMPETGKVYGLLQDRWADQRYNPARATEAAAALLSDLKRRFGTWELAMAAYNMGYGGIVGLLKRYNTNDYWALSELEGSLPWETTLYVPKIVALSVVMKNLQLFGFKEMQKDAPMEGDEISAPPQTLLSTIAQAAGVNVKEIEALNPELRAGRTPPETQYPVKVPRGRGEGTQIALRKKRESSLERYTVRAGETLSEIAAQLGTTVGALSETNKLSAAEALRPGMVLLLPKGIKSPDEESVQSAQTDRTVVTPQESFTYPDRKRVFYRVLTGDTLGDLAPRLGVTVDELRRWNVLDAEARLHEGMTLQAFVAKDAKLTTIRTLPEEAVRIVPVNSAAFFELWESKGRTRETVIAKAGDTLESIGQQYGVGAGLMERINRKGRKDPLRAGEPIVVYVDASSKTSERTAKNDKSSSDVGTTTLGDALVEPLPALP